MAKKQLLYITSNDGSDTRINKEINTLSKEFEIDFIGIGLGNNAFVKSNCKNFYLISGSRKSLGSWLKLALKVYRLCLLRKYHSIHMINEQLLIVLYPCCFFKHSVVDLFDSFFLKTSYKGWWVELMRKVLFAPVNKIVVTDNNRKSLIPSYLQRKIIVVENYPNLVSFTKEKQNDKIILFYTGWMGLGRGTLLVQKLIEKYDDIELWMAGWFADEVTESLYKNEKVKYWGVRPQIETMKLAAQADYILCLYAPIHDNNINASPNKIYDAIQVRTPVIINQEVKVSAFVKEHQLGIIIPEFDWSDIDKFHKDLVDKRGTFIFDDNLKRAFCWEKVEKKLVDCHV
jgi:hypothetical protein